MTIAVIALGSNLGDRIANLRAAVRLLAEDGGVRFERRSSVWETAPVPAGQPAFLNAVIAVETALGPEELLARLKGIEYELGRRPERRWGPRPIDLDILFHGVGAFESERLEVPHARLAERNFVLAPLGEVMEGELPVLGRSATALLASVGREGLTRTPLTL